jgi:hypothetical protein
MTFVAIARCLAKAFFLFKMMARGGPIRGANQDSEAARRMRIGSSRSKSINHRHADFQFGSGSPLAIFFNKLPGHQSVAQMASLSGDFRHQMGQLRPKSCLFRDKRYSEQRLRWSDPRLRTGCNSHTAGLDSPVGWKQAICTAQHESPCCSAASSSRSAAARPRGQPLSPSTI